MMPDLALWRRLRPQPSEGTAQVPVLPPGDGPLVLLHGWMDVGASYQFTVDALRQQRRELAELPAADGRSGQGTDTADCSYLQSAQVNVSQAPAVQAQRAHPAVLEVDPLGVDAAQVQLVDPGGPDEEVAHGGSGEVGEAQAAVLNEERLDIGVERRRRASVQSRTHRAWSA